MNRDKYKEDFKNIKFEDLDEVEKEFYECFNITERNGECEYFSGNIGYPPISSKMLIDLLALENKIMLEGLGVCSLVSGSSYNEVKNSILKDAIRPFKFTRWKPDTELDRELQDFYNAVRELF